MLVSRWYEGLVSNGKRVLRRNLIVVIWNDTHTPPEASSTCATFHVRVHTTTHSAQKRKPPWDLPPTSPLHRNSPKPLKKSHLLTIGRKDGNERIKKKASGMVEEEGEEARRKGEEGRGKREGGILLVYKVGLVPLKINSV